jgi:hypothetical protein
LPPCLLPVLLNILPLKGWIEDKCAYICWCIASKSVVFVKLCLARVDTSRYKRVVLIL